MAYTALFSFSGSLPLDADYFLVAITSPDDFILTDARIPETSASHAHGRNDHGADHNVDSLFSPDSGIAFLSTEYLQITADGLIQIDFDGGGDDWVTIGTLESAQANGIVHAGGSGLVGVLIAHPNNNAAGGLELAGSHFLPWLMDDMGQGYVEAAQPFVI